MTASYYRARYYEPAIGRFLQEDPSRSEVGLSPYVYADNDPADYGDWDGRKPKKIPPPSLPLGTPQREIQMFDQGWDEMLNVLNHKDCQKFFCDHGFDRDKVLQTLQATAYSFQVLKQGPDYGAQTNGPDSVFINSEGQFVTNQNGIIYLNRQEYNLYNPTNVQAMILLHELGHQLNIFGPDYGSPDNAAHTIEILKHCFTGSSFPVTQ